MPDRDIYEASDAVKAHWPMAEGKPISGNDINGLGVAEKIPMTPVFWRPDGTVTHIDVQNYFYQRDADNERIREARTMREETFSIPVNGLATEQEDRDPEEWSQLVKEAARSFGADATGISAYRPEWTYKDRDQPAGKWAIVMGFAHDYAEMDGAPDDDAYIEVMRQYARAGNAAKHLANWIQDRGHVAEGKVGPNTDDVLMIPAAIEAGLGELGKHGSIINRELGSNFRLSMVTTDLPVIPDKPDVFGADVFCESCQLCSSACPPDAIFREKKMVRGETKWYVDFDKCVPYFVDNKTCGLCLVVCPWSRPGIAPNLLQKMAKRI